MILTFEIKGVTIVTNSWTVRDNGAKGVILCYIWGANDVSFFDGATGTSRAHFAMSIQEFIKRLASAKASGICQIEPEQVVSPNSFW